MAARVAIVGGGVSGLATAYFLGRLGIRSVLIEKSQRLGGLIQSDCVAGCLLEAGPDSYLSAKPSVGELASELGTLDGQRLDGQIMGSNDAARRVFVVRDGRLVAMPRGMALMVPGDWRSTLGSDLFSRRTKLRFVRETFFHPRKRENDVSVSEFIQEHFGLEVLDYVAEPLLTGVYGGDAGGLSARSVLPRFIGYEEKCGSLIRAVRHERRGREQGGSLFHSFRDGMQSFTDALARAAGDHMTVIHAEATGVERSKGGWRICYGQGRVVEADDVVLACPAHVAARLLDREAPLLARELAAIPYSSAILVTLVYGRAEFEHPLDGFGFLVPHAERGTIAAATWISTKFPSRVRADLAAVRAFVVGKNAEELLGAAESDLVELVRADLARFMGIDATPRVSSVHIWPQSMPQYVVGHGERRQVIQAALREQRRLYLAGNAYDGVGIPDCVRLAKETAKQIAGSTEP